jgi:hypothetical protein
VLSRRHWLCSCERISCKGLVSISASPESHLLSRSPIGLHVIATARDKDAIKDLEAMGMSTLSLEVTSNESIAKAKGEVELLTKGRLDIVSANTPP